MDYTLQFAKYLTNHGMSEVVLKEFMNQIVIKHVNKGQMILNMGEHTDEINVILKGIVRGVYISEDGDEITKCFSYEGQCCCAYNLFSTEPSKYWIEAIEDCVMVRVPVSFLKRMMKEEPEVQRMYGAICVEQLMINEERAVSFQQQSAKERYIQFNEKYPQLIGRIDLRYIASYLGITPSSLSRIRRDLQN